MIEKIPIEGDELEILRADNATLRDLSQRIALENFKLRKENLLRHERIEKLEEALSWYADKSNIEDRIKITEKHQAGDWITIATMYDDVTKVAQDALESNKGVT